MKVTDIFQTLEGELPFVGMRAIYVRIDDSAQPQYTLVDDPEEITKRIFKFKNKGLVVFSKATTGKELFQIASIAEKIKPAGHLVSLEMDHKLSYKFIENFKKYYSPYVDMYNLNIEPFQDKLIHERGLMMTEKVFYKFKFKTRNEFLDHFTRYYSYMGTRSKDAFVIDASHYDAWYKVFKQVADVFPAQEIRLSPSLHLTLGIK